jgi:uncharacterized protein (TIGR02453 family)
MAFSGLSKDGDRFFAQLAARQDRDWFKAHKAEFTSLWEEPMRALLDELSVQLGKQYKGVALMKPKHFRIYRDVRFSKDKSPFKTFAAAVVMWPGGEDSGAPAALYLHLGTEDTIAAGHWFFPPDKLKRYRALVADEKTGKALERRVDALEKKGFVAEAFEATKRVPPGFEPDHPRARLLKQKGLGVTFPKIPKGVRHSQKLAKWIAEQSAVVAPFVTWLEAQL